MWLYLKNLRTFFFWRFSRKIHFVGFFCVFLVFFIFFHLWLINDRIKGHFHHEGKPVAAKCTFMKIINGQRSFERSKKISPSGATKVPKSAKFIFLTESLWSNWWFEQPERSARSRTIRSKIVSIQWGFQKCNSFTCSDIRKKLIFWSFGIMTDRMINHCITLSCIWCSTRSSCSELETA